MINLESSKQTAREALQAAKRASDLALYAIGHSDNQNTIDALMSDMRKQQLLADDALLTYRQAKEAEVAQ